MLHIIKEGDRYHIGLNIKKCYRSIGFHWVWYDTYKQEVTVRGFRIRFHIRPWLVTRKVNRWQVIEK